MFKCCALGRPYSLTTACCLHCLHPLTGACIRSLWPVYKSWLFLTELADRPGGSPNHPKHHTQTPAFGGLHSPNKTALCPLLAYL